MAATHEVGPTLVGYATIDINDIDVADVTSREAIGIIDARVAENASLGVAFLNAHASNVAGRNADFASALKKMLVFNDGIGVDMAAVMLTGRRFADNLNGTDFIPAYLGTSVHRHRVFLLGGRPGVAERAQDRLKTFGEHDFVGCRDGFFGPDEAEAVAATIRASGATMLLVALGNPIQEIWIARHLEATGVRVAFGIGALFDFMAGEVPRAPAFMRRHGLEWLFRLAIEPRRLFHRYIVGNPAFLLRTWRYKVSRRA